jgi:WD40 repeat protein
VVLWDLSALLPGEQALAAALAAARASEAGGGSSGGGAAVRRPSSNSSCMAAAPGQVQQAACWQLGRDHATCIALARDGSVLAVGTRSGGVHVVASCSTAARQLVQLPSRHSEACKVRCAALSPDATKLATTADDARLVLWDVARGSCLLAIHEHTKAVRGCCWSPDGKHIATVGDDSLLCVLDVMLLHSRSGNSGSAAKGGAAAPAGTTPGSSSKRGSRLLRMPLRLNGAAALTAGDAAAAAEAEEAGEGVVASSVPPHPQLQRIDVSLVKERLLACMPLPQPASTCASSFNGTAAAAAAAAGDAVSDGVLCAGHTGQLLLLPPGCAAAVSTGLHVGSGIACCSFDGGVVAAARRDGAVTVVSCSPASAAIGTSVTVTSTAGSTIGATPAPPAAAARRVSGGGQGPFAAAPSAISAAAAAAALAAAAGGHPAELPAAVSTKLDMVVLGISVCRALGRVALVGCERKATQTGVAHLWEFDPSVRPAAQPPGGAGAGGARRAGLGASGSRSLLDRHESSRSLLSSEDSGLSDGGTTSPSRLSMDLDGALTPAPPRGSAGGFGAFWDNLGAGLHHPKGGGGRAAGKGGGGTAAGGGHQHHAAANLRLSSGTELGLSAASAGVLGRSVGPAGWLWHCDNPVKVLSCQEAPLLCCAWEVRGDSPRLVVGSAAGWLSVVNLEGEELEETMVRPPSTCVFCWGEGGVSMAVSPCKGSRRHILRRPAPDRHPCMPLPPMPPCRHVRHQSRFQIHSCEVAAVDCAADGATVVSGGADGSIVLWSHVTGFKLAAFTVHAAAIRTLCFSAGVSAGRRVSSLNGQHARPMLRGVRALSLTDAARLCHIARADAGLLAAGDAAGVVSAWDVAQGCLLSAAQVHDGLVSSVAWSSGSTACAATASGSAGSNGSAGGLSVISGGYDGAVSVLQVRRLAAARLPCVALRGFAVATPVLLTQTHPPTHTPSGRSEHQPPVLRRLLWPVPQLQEDQQGAFMLAWAALVTAGGHPRLPVVCATTVLATHEHTCCIHSCAHLALC